MNPTWEQILDALDEDEHQAIWKIVIDEASLDPCIGCSDSEYVREIRHALWRRTRGEYSRIDDETVLLALEKAKMRFRALVKESAGIDLRAAVLSTNRSRAVAAAVHGRLLEQPNTASDTK